MWPFRSVKILLNECYEMSALEKYSLIIHSFIALVLNAYGLLELFRKTESKIYFLLSKYLYRIKKAPTKMFD